MLSKIDQDIGFIQSALNIRALRQEVLASNLANSDTPNYKARDVDFQTALTAAKGALGGNLALTRTDADADACTAERLVFSVGSLVLFDCPLIWFDRDPFAPYFAPPRKRP